MTQRAWFDLAAALRLSEHVLSRPTIDPHRPAGPAEPSLLLTGGRWPRLTSNRLPALGAGNTIAAIHADGPNPAGRTETWLALADTGAGIALRDLLRDGFRRGEHWFTVATDGTAPATTTYRDTATIPDHCDWISATITDPVLGTHQGQTARGYHDHGAAFVRIHDASLWQLFTGDNPAATVCIHHQQRRIHLHIDAAAESVAIGADGSGYYRLEHPALRWTARPDPADPGDDVFAYDPRGPRCTVCGAVVGDDDMWESPSMAGYGEDTAITCRLCGSHQTTDPIFGLDNHPAVWPPRTDIPSPSNTPAVPAHPTLENPEVLP